MSSRNNPSPSARGGQSSDTIKANVCVPETKKRERNKGTSAENHDDDTTVTRTGDGNDDHDHGPSGTLSPSMATRRKRNRMNDDTSGHSHSKSQNGEEKQKTNKNENAAADEVLRKAIQIQIDDGEDDGDWKRPLFYWKGDLSYNDSTSSTTKTSNNNKLTWKGSWVADLASNGLPEAEEFLASMDTNSFQLTSTKLKLEIDKKGGAGTTRTRKRGTSESGAMNSGVLNTENGERAESAENALQNLVGKSGSFKGTYLLDQGDGKGPTKQRDYAHNYTFDSSTRIVRNCGCTRTSVLFITASGTTAFGNFVSAGYVMERQKQKHSNSDSSCLAEFELVLARRYIDESDAREALVQSKSHAQMLAKEIPHPGMDLSLSVGGRDRGKADNNSILWTILLPRSSND